MKKRILTVVVCLSAAGVRPAAAQLPGLPKAAEAQQRAEASAAAVPQSGPVRGSLFKQGAAAANAQGIAGVAAPAQPTSFIAVRAPEPKQYRKNDLLTVVIREDSDSSSNGEANAKKTQDFDFAIQQFLKLALSSSGIPTVTNVDSPSSLPEIKFKFSNDRKSDASQERTDTFSARLSATVVDVKPNGTLVIEAVKQIVVDKEVQTFKLSGVCRVEDIHLDNTILSTQIANLALSKQTKGNVHDGNKRGWLNGLIDRFNPF